MTEYTRGRQAYNSGTSLSANPHVWGVYSGSNHPHTDWNDGWMDGCRSDSSAGRLYKMLSSSGTSMATCQAAEDRLA